MRSRPPFIARAGTRRFAVTRSAQVAFPIDGMRLRNFARRRHTETDLPHNAGISCRSTSEHLRNKSARLWHATDPRVPRSETVDVDPILRSRCISHSHGTRLRTRRIRRIETARHARLGNYNAGPYGHRHVP